VENFRDSEKERYMHLGTELKKLFKNSVNIDGN
jgi:hypothetical protein